MKSLTSIITTSALLLCLGTIVPAHADITFTPGNHPQADEQNILFDQNDSVNPIFGTTNQSHTTVKFDSTTDALLAPSNGQARLDASDGLINDLTITVPGGCYHDLILNPFLGEDVKKNSGDEEITVVANDGTFTYDSALENGNNFLTIVATDGECILSTTLDSKSGFEELKQPRISGVVCDHQGPPVTPEPSSLALLFGGGLPLLGMLRRKSA